LKGASCDHALIVQMIPATYFAAIAFAGRQVFAYVEELVALLHDPQSELFQHGTSRRLIVLLHGWMRSPADFKDLSGLLAEESRDADHYIPKLPIGLFSKAVPETVVGALVNNITSLWERRCGLAGGSYNEIVLVGHSCGAVLTRAVLTAAFGAGRDATIRSGCRKEWAPKISRIVMFAAVNRGYNPNSAMSVPLRISSWFGDWLDRLPGGRFFVFNVRRGASFLTTIRLQWFTVMRSLENAGEEPPIVCQLLGTMDDLVAPADNIDLATGQSFYYLEAPKSGHFNIVDFKGADGRRRWEVFKIALHASEEELHRNAIPLSDVTDIFDEAEEDHDVTIGGRTAAHSFGDVTHVVFVIHGIRDYGFWTRKIAARVKSRARAAGYNCRSVTSTYGYFPMGPFLLLTERRKRVEWLMDQYVTARSLYPNACFSYIGHSNGTYLLASAVKACPAIKFDRVVFAGSVVRRDFDWPAYLPGPESVYADGAGQNYVPYLGSLAMPSVDRQTAQVQRVVNYAATADWVVALVPRFCQAWKKLDLGDAGHHGFARSVEGLRQIRYVPGAHSAALGEQHWDEIAAFAVGGADPIETPPVDKGSDDTDVSLKGRRERRHKFRVAMLAYGAWIVVPFVVGVACIPGILLLRSLGLFGEPAPVLWALLFTGYCWLISRVLTRI